MASKLTRILSLVWDKAAATRVQQEAEEALSRTGKQSSEEFERQLGLGGKKAARALSTSLEREYKLRMGRLREQLAEGTINEQAFEREGREAAIAFNRGLTNGIRALRAQGTSTDLELANLAGRFKSTSAGAAAAAGAAGGALAKAWGPLAGLVTAGAAFGEARIAIEASDNLEKSVRRLGASSLITGVDLGVLEENVRRTREEFGLSERTANDLTGVMARLAAQAGETNRMGDFTAAWLDLMAANGVKAADSGEMLTSILAGQDEALNRLGLANPSQIYEKWGAGEDQASQAGAIFNEILEAGKKVLGEHSRALETNAGRAAQAAEKLEDMRAANGRNLQEARALANELKLELYPALTDIYNIIADLIVVTKGPITLTVNIVGTAVEWLARFAAFMQGDPNAMRIGGWSRNPQSKLPPGASSNLGWADRDRGGTRVGVLPGLTVTGMTKEQRDGADAAAKRRGETEFLAGQYGSRFGDPAARGPVDAVSTRMVDVAKAGISGPTRELDFLFLDLWQSIYDGADRTAAGMAGAFEEAFEQIGEDGDNIGSFFEKLGSGIGASMLGGIAEFAQAKAAENIAFAIEQTAKALGFAVTNPFGAATSTASAGEHLAAAAAWSALAGGLGAAGGALSGGGHRGGGHFRNPRDAGLDTAQDAERNGPEFHLYINPWDSENVLMQRSVYGAMQYARERFGEDTRIITHPYPSVGK